MIDLSTLTPQLQATHWGWTIALFLWFIGLSGMGFFINYWVRQKNFVYVLTFCGIAGLALVTSHLGRLSNLPFVIFLCPPGLLLQLPVLDDDRNCSSFPA